MNIEIKYQAEDGEIRYYHFESWELAEDDAFREAMQEFRSTRTGKNKILSIRNALTLATNLKPCKTLWVATFRCFIRTSTARWA